MDAAEVKRYFKEADDAAALAMYNWIVGAMEVRGLIEIPTAGRKRRSDAGTQRGATLTNSVTQAELPQ